MSDKCYLCKELISISYKFKKETIVNNDNLSNYCHIMCPECLIRHIFITDITIFEYPSAEYTFTCPCEKGKLKLTYEQLIDAFQNKTFDNLQKKKEKICKVHNKLFNKYCKDCDVDICEDCLIEIVEDHFNHRIEEKEKLLKKMRKFFDVLNLKYYEFKKFMENFNLICQQFKEILEKNYNETLIYIDKIINNLIDFRAKYSVHYKEKVINSVQTLKILKMFYCNYYYDIKKAEKGNDFKIYKYLNQINKELDGVTFIDNKESMDKINKIMENTDYLNNNINKLLDIKYNFRHVLNIYRKYQSIQRCDDIKLKSIVKIDEHKIITTGEGLYMNYFEEKDGEFSKPSQIQTKDKITSILLFKNGNLLTSFGKSSHFNIQEWKPSDNDSNINYFNDDLLYNNMINDSDLISERVSLNRATTFEQPRGRLKSFQINTNNNSLYEKANSFLSTHKDDINVMIELDDSMFVSGGNDKILIIWKRDEESQKFKIFQKSTKEHKNPINNIRFLYDKKLVSCDSNTINIWSIEQNKLNNPNNNYSVLQKINYNNGNLTSIFQIRDGTLFLGNSNSILEIWGEIDGKYKSIQNINLKINGITCINQLKDNRVIVCSHQGIIKILSMDKNEYQINESITTIQGIPIHFVECFEDGSFIVGQKTSLHVWKNNESI